MYGNNYDYVSSSVDLANVGVYGIIALIVAVCGAIVLYYTFLTKSNEKKFKGFLGWLYDFLTFKNLFIEGILKFLYLLTAIFITLMSFNLIGTNFLAFVVMLILGNVIVRIAYEGALMLILMYRNLVEINKKTK